MRLTLEECKYKVVGICTDIGIMLPDNEDDLPDSWQDLSDSLAELASILGGCVSSLASYSAIASRKAKNE